MPYYHVRITVLGERRDEVKVDVDGETLSVSSSSRIARGGQS